VPGAAAPGAAAPGAAAPGAAAPGADVSESATEAGSEPEKETAEAGPTTETYGTKLTFRDAVSAPAIRQWLREAYAKARPSATVGTNATAAASSGEQQGGLPDLPDLRIDDSELFAREPGASVQSKVWFIRMTTPLQDAQAVLDTMKATLAETPVLLSSSEIGGKVAGDTRTLAIASVVSSWFAIIVYLWIRFQRVAFGIAAVVALVHDVLITIGAIALSAYVASSLPFLMIDEFKISLPVVAALLTIIGYSVNDTIIVFDRIRENRGKSPALTAEMINASINQTLARTLLTSGTTLIVVVVLYVMGGQAIHSFAFALLVGVVAGTYSTVFMAAPVAMWLFKSGKSTVRDRLEA